MRGRVIALALVTGAWLAPGAGASDVQGVAETTRAARDVMVVPNAEGGTVSLIDARSFAVLREIDVLPDGREATFDDDPAHAAVGQQIVEAAGGPNYAQDVDVSPDGRTLYVSRGHRGDVAAFDLSRGTLQWKVRIPGFRADHMTISEDGRRLYVSALTEDEVEVVDTQTHAVVGTFASGQWPHDNHLSDDGRRLYNGSIGNIIAPSEARESGSGSPYRLTVVEPETLGRLAAYEFERGIRPYVITHDETRMYAQLSEYHGVIEFGFPEGRILRTRDLPVDPGVTDEDYDFEAPHHGLAMTPDESTLCAAGRASDYVALISTGTLEPTAIIDVDDAPGWAAVDPSGRLCFVANTRADTVSVISFAQRREVARLRGGDGPKLIQPTRLPASVACAGAKTPGCEPRLRLRRRCRANGGLRLRLRGETNAVKRAAFRIGRRALAHDRRAPFRYVFSRRQLRRYEGRRVVVAARVTAGPRPVVKRAARLQRCD